MQTKPCQRKSADFKGGQMKERVVLLKNYLKKFTKSENITTDIIIQDKKDMIRNQKFFRTDK